MKEELLKSSEFVYKTAKTEVKRYPYLFIEEQMINHLKNRLNCLGYEYISPNSSYKDFLNISSLSYYCSSCSINIFSLYRSEEEARKGILDVLDTLKMTIKDLFSINIVNGILPSNYEYVSLLINKDNTSIRIGEFIFIQENDAFYVKGHINLNTLPSLITYHSDDSILKISSEIALTQISIIPHKMNEPGISKTCKEVEDLLQNEGYRVKYFSSTEPVNEKINYSNLHAIPLRIEVSPKDLAKGVVKVYLSYDNSYQEVSLSSITKNIKIILSRLNKNLYSSSINHNFECEQGTYDTYQINYLCHSCIQNLKDKEKEYFLPFNQNFMEERCKICNNIATKRVVSLFKES